MKIPAQVWELVYERTGYTSSEILGDKRDGRLPDVRHSLMYALYRLGWSRCQIARDMRRDRKAVVHALHKIDTIIRRNPEGNTKQLVGQIMSAALPHLFFDPETAVRKASTSSSGKNPYARLGV